MAFQKGNKGYWLGKHRSEETRRIIGEKQLGRIPWNKGLTKEMDERVRKYAESGRKTRKIKEWGFKKGYTPWNKGLPSELQPSYGRPVSKETRIKNGFAHKKENLSPEQYRKMLERNRIIGKGNRGKNNPAWRGGVSKLPYPFNFDKELRELIRKRDDYKCQECGCPQIENGENLSVHHIDKDKNNVSPDNLVSLCKSCHGKIHFPPTKVLRSNNA